MNTHVKLHIIQLKQLSQTHPLHELNTQLDPPKNMKATIFITTNIVNSDPDITTEECKETSNLLIK